MMPRAQAAVAPALTLAEIFGPGCVFSPRASFSRYGWLPTDPAVLDFLTGGQFTVAGGMPVVCSRCVATAAVLDVLRGAGLPVARTLYPYDTEAEYRGVLAALGRGDLRVVLQHVHPPDELAADRYWVPPGLLSRLNNKANLALFVPEAHVPRRRLVPPRDLWVAARPGVALPAVVKAASDLSSGGGVDVVVCAGEDDLRHAAAFFESCQAVVVEEYLTIAQNLCIQFASTVSGEIVYLGTAEQVSSAQGRYQGNWLGTGSEPAGLIDLGRTIMERGCALGYRGIAGFDVIVTQDGRMLVIDLNFRLNGSTVPLLLRDGVVRALGARVMRFRSWQARREFGAVLDAVKAAAERGHLVPLSLYDPRPGPYEDAVPRLAGLLVGDSPDEVADRERRLAEQGIE